MKSNEHGFTLIELLAVLVISSVFIGLAYTILFSTGKSVNKSLNQTNLRNESILIVQQLDDYMKNIDATNPRVGNSLDKFEAVNIKGYIDSNGNVVREPENEKKLIIEITNDGYLLVNKQRLHSEQYRLTGTTFQIDNNVVKVNLVITDPKNRLENKLNKIYRLQSG